MTLHEWVYGIVSETCEDREYVYYAFYTYFTKLCKELYGGSSDGKMTISGIKSEHDALLSWRLRRIPDLIGGNTAQFECRMVSKHGGEEISSEKASFELSGGTAVA